MVVCFPFTSGSKSDRIGAFLSLDSPAHATFLSGFPENPTLSSLLTEEELDIYVRHFQYSGFKQNVFWYATAALNFQEKDQHTDLSTDNPATYPIETMIKLPAFIITSGRDPVIHPLLSQGMEKWVPTLKRAQVDHTAHWIQMEDPKKVNALIQQFFEQLDKTKDKTVALSKL